jgi:UDP-N-acetyl-D-mannosaminuronic acid dehydrogenase
MTKFKNIAVIGLGYIGLPTAAMFASSGIKVVGVDVNHEVVDTINKGNIHIVENGLRELVSDAVNSGNLSASTTPSEADAYIISVPTPFLENKTSTIPEPDLSFIYEAIKSISKYLKPGNLIILESTSPVGTTEKIVDWIGKLRPDLILPKIDTNQSLESIRIAYCPERVLPGNIINELIHNDRVIGGISLDCALLAEDLYKVFLQGDCTITDSKTAEMVKLTENSSRDVQIAFANELSLICDDNGIDVLNLIKIANKHPRVDILNPGAGVGGHCIAVDPWFIIHKNPTQANLIKTAREVNNSKPTWVIKKVDELLEDYFNKNLNKDRADIKICCYGLSFKPDIDDLRESPALFITRELAKKYRDKVFAIEPNIKNLEGEDLELVELPPSDTLISLILVNHSSFHNAIIKSDILFDLHGIVS